MSGFKLKLPIGIRKRVSQVEDGKLKRLMRGSKTMNKKIIALILYSTDKAMPGCFRIKFMERKEMIPKVIESGINGKSRKSIRELRKFLEDDAIHPFKFYEEMRLPEEKTKEVLSYFESLAQIPDSVSREFNEAEKESLGKLKVIVDEIYDKYEKDTQELIDSVKGEK